MENTKRAANSLKYENTVNSKGNLEKKRIKENLKIIHIALAACCQ